MFQKVLFIHSLLISLLCGLTFVAMAKVSPEQADRLGKDLTPFGAERAGNADGTIPAWEGGLSKIPDGITYKPGQFLQDPFTDDKVLFSITAANMEKYADKLSDGQKAMLKRYPDSYRLDIYPTRRTAAAPEWVYKNTRENAVRGTMTEDRLGVVDVYGGIPFPIPQSAEEAVFNYLLRWKGDSGSGTAKSGIILPDGTFSMAGGGYTYEKWPYYQENGSLESFSGDYWELYQLMETPQRRKGELLVVIDNVNPFQNPRKAWQYLPGQRRVRRAPTVAYDTPNPSSSGLATYDDAYLFNGALDRYDWKIAGKKEMYIPYNNFQMPLAAEKDLLTPKFANPDKTRWELHRVWVIEATLKDGKRHCYAKRVLYLDEDTWIVVLTDKYDSKDNLWRTSLQAVYSFYFLPAVREMERFNYDFQVETYSADALFNDEKEFVTYQPVDDEVFTPANLRRQGRR